MIRFDRVTKLYPGNSKPALNGVDVEIKAGEFVFLVGASGSGKSSFLRLVLKEEKPSSGEIHVLGQRLGSISSRKVPYFRRSLGVVFQDFRLLPGRTVFQNVAFTLQVIGKSKGFIQEAVPDVIRMVGLAGKEDRLPHELSGGEQQRVAIARAVVNKPAILLADEPTGNLDPTTSQGIMQVLELINAGGTTVVMATHDVSIVDTMKRRVIELTGGNIIRDESSGGYTTSIPILSDALPATQAMPTVTGASAFAAALAEEGQPLDLPSTPRTVVETASEVAPAADPAPEPARAPRHAPQPVAETQAQPASAAPAAEIPVPAMASAQNGRPGDWDAYPMTAPIAVPTATGAIPRLSAYEQRLRADRDAAAAAPTAPAAPAPRTAAAAPPPAEQPPAPPITEDDPLALAVRLGLRRPGAAPESPDSQEVGPTS